MSPARGRRGRLEADDVAEAHLLENAFCNLCRACRACEPRYAIGQHKVLVCTHCGLVFTVQDGFSQDSAARLYSKDYFESGVVDGYADYAASEDTLRHQARRILRRLRRFRSSGTLLELGCAYGFFLLEAREFFDVRGVELSAFAAQQARSRGLDVQASRFEDVQLSDGFDAVCLFDCVEHLLDPFGYLRKIHSLLAPDGVLALTTGDIGSLYARASGARWRLMTPPQHRFFFSKTTMREMLTRTGFEIVEVSYPWKLVPLRLMLYQLSPRLKTALGPLGRSRFGLYVNLFDAMFVIAKKADTPNLPERRA